MNNFLWLDLIPLFSLLAGILMFSKPVEKDKFGNEILYDKQLKYFSILYATLSLIYIIIKCWFVFSYHYLQ